MKGRKLLSFLVIVMLPVLLYITGVLPVIISTERTTYIDSKNIDYIDVINLSDYFRDSTSRLTLYFKKHNNVNFSTLYECKIESRDYDKLELEVTGGDMTTVTDYIWMTSDEGGNVKLKMTVDGVLGIQSTDLGWLEFTKQDSIRQMIDLANPVFSPLVII